MRKTNLLNRELETLTTAPLSAGRTPNVHCRHSIVATMGPPSVDAQTLLRETQLGQQGIHNRKKTNPRILKKYLTKKSWEISESKTKNKERDREKGK